MPESGRPRTFRLSHALIFASLLVGTLTSIGSVGFYFGEVVPMAERVTRERDWLLAQERDYIRHRQADLDKLRAEANRITHEIEQLRIDAGLPPSPKPNGASSAWGVPLAPREPRPSNPSLAGPCKCIDPRDPLCDCLR